MKKRLLLLGLISIVGINVCAQNKMHNTYMPLIGIKTNALYWATTTPNLGVEFAISNKTTIDISGGYNPWTFAANKKFKHWLIQPEFRYWLCERFNGHFWGVHAHYAEYNVGGVKKLGLQNYRYQGSLYGGGISYGYHWILNKRWSVEGTIGMGYAHIEYAKYSCEKCGDKIKDTSKNYWGPTKAGISLIYIHQ